MRNYYSISGIIGTISILLIIVVFSFLTPGYSHIWQTISELNGSDSALRLPMNICYTFGFSFLIIFSCFFTFSKNYYAKFSGFLMIVAILLIIFMNWFLPMDSIAGIRTARDQAHNNTITLAVIIFLLSQIFAVLFWQLRKEKFLRDVTAYTLVISLIFGLMSLYANITRSELINLSERGWMLSFLIYFLLIAKNLPKKFS